MPPDRETTSREASLPSNDGLADIACEACRERRLKCSKRLPACEFCSSRGFECLYRRKVRTPLTRKNLDAAEARILQLEAYLAGQGGAQSLGNTQESQAGPSTATSSQHAPTAPTFAPSSRSDSWGAMQPPAPPHTSDNPLGAVVDSVGTPLHFRLPDDSTVSVHLRWNAPTARQAATNAHFAEPSISPVAQGTIGPSSSASAAWPTAAETSGEMAMDADAEMADETAAEEVEADGTGTFDDAESGRAGFLGPASGSALLRFLQRVCTGDPQIFSQPPRARSAPSPSSSALTSTVITPENCARYVDAYFSVYGTQYPLIHEPTFRAELAEVIPRPHPASWTLLYQVVLGIGSCCFPDRADQSDSIALLARANKLVHTHLLETSTTTATQAFILLGNLAQRLNRPNLGHIFLGVALRMALSLGLHREPSPTLSVFEQESRRRIYWTLLSFESGSVTTFGHPSTLPAKEANVRPISNVPDELLKPAATEMPGPVDGPTIYSSLQQHARFHAFAAGIVEQTVGDPQAEDMLRLEAEVVTWRSTLPPYFFALDVPSWFEFARERLQWRCEHLRMLALRPAFLRVAHESLLADGNISPELESCWSHCLASAISTINSIKTYIDAVPKRTKIETFYTNIFLFSAVFVPLIALRTRPQHDGAFEWLLSVQSALSILEHFKFNPLAERCSQIITAVVAMSHSSLNPPPQTASDVVAMKSWDPTPVATPSAGAHFFASTHMPIASGEEGLAFPTQLFPFLNDANAASNPSAPTASFDAMLAQWLAPELGP